MKLSTLVRKKKGAIGAFLRYVVAHSAEKGGERLSFREVAEYVTGLAKISHKRENDVNSLIAATRDTLLDVGFVYCFDHQPNGNGSERGFRLVPRTDETHAERLAQETARQARRAIPPIIRAGKIVQGHAPGTLLPMHVHQAPELRQVLRMTTPMLETKESLQLMDERMLTKQEKWEQSKKERNAAKGKQAWERDDTGRMVPKRVTA